MRVARGRQVLHGSDDCLIPARHGRELAAAIPDAKLVIVRLHPTHKGISSTCRNMFFTGVVVLQNCFKRCNIMVVTEDTSESLCFGTRSHWAGARAQPY